MTISKFLSTAAIIFSLTILGAEAKPPAGSSDAGSHVNKGVELAQQHKYDDAIKEFTAAIEANSKNAKAYLNRGTAYRAMWAQEMTSPSAGQKYDAAMADFAKAIEIAPKDEMGYLERGQTFVMQKQYSDALADLSKAAELKPQGRYDCADSPRSGWGTGIKRRRILRRFCKRIRTMRRLMNAADSCFAAKRNITRRSPITTRVWRSNPTPTFTRSGVTPTSPICKITRKGSRIISKLLGSIPTITIRSNACSTRNRLSPPKMPRLPGPLRHRHPGLPCLRH